MIPPISYLKASSLDEALEHLAAPGAVLHAGGTDLLGCLRDGAVEARTVVSLGGIGELRGITASADGGLRIGALTTIAEIASDPRIVERYPVLAQAAIAIASPQLRNQGSLGGNLCQRPRCWYFRGPYPCAKKGGDLCYAVDGENQYHCIFGGGPCYIVHPSDAAPALMALDARLTVAGPGGERTLPIAEFFRLPADSLEAENVLSPGEILTEIALLPPAAGARSAYRKVRARAAWDFALASAAIVLAFRGEVVERARIVLGGVAPVPWPVEAAETALAGRRLDAAAVTAAAEAAVRDAAPLSGNAYKVELVKGILREQLEGLARPAA